MNQVPARPGAAAPSVEQATVGSPAPEPATRHTAGPRRWLRLAAIILVLTGLAIAAWTWTRGALLYVSETDARVRADLVDIASETDGRLMARPVDAGDRVTRGQVLAQVDDRAVVLLIEETDAEQARLLAELGRLDAETALIRTLADSRIRSATARLEEAVTTVDVFEHELGFAASDFERARSLSATGAASTARLDRARTDFLKARQELSRARAEVETARAGVAEARAELAEIAIKEADRDRLSAALAEIAARRERLQVDLSNRTLVSPIDGVIGRAFVEAGEFVAEGQRLMSVHDPDAIWVEANVRETEIGRLAVGQPVEIGVDAYPGETFLGQIARIADAANSQYALLPRLNESGTFTKVTQRLEVRIAVESDDGRLKPGMMVEVRIDAPSDGYWPF